MPRHSFNMLIRCAMVLALPTAFLVVAQPGSALAETAPGTITTVAGSGAFGGGCGAFSGDGGQATVAELNCPYDVSVDAADNFYVADTYNNRIRKVDTSGVITTVAGNGTPGFSGDGGPATSAQLSGPTAVAIDASGNDYIVDAGNLRIRKVDRSGRISTFAGGGSGDDGELATNAQLSHLAGLTIDSDGNVYITDGNRIRKIDTSGVITTVAGTGQGDDVLNYPADVTVDSAGNVYISDLFNNRVRRRDIGGAITTVAGTGQWGFSGDGGPATEAQLAEPQGLTVDSAGDLFISDRFNNRIREVDASGVITTVAGDGSDGFSGDGGPATSAGFYNAIGLAVDSVGNLYIATTSDNRIRMVAGVASPSGGSSPHPLSFSPTSGKPGTSFVATYSCSSGSPTMTVVNTDATKTATSDIDVILPVSSNGAYRQSVVIGREGDYTAAVTCAGVALGSSALHVEQTLTYAGLGDSYSSGEGALAADGSTPYYIPPSDGRLNNCHRATTAWPMLIRTATSTTIDFAACSGAVIDDFQAFNHNNGFEVPQRDHISPNVTRLVSLSVGGNDIGFPDIAAACVMVGPVGGDCQKRDSDAMRDKDPTTTSIAQALTWLTDGRPKPGCVWLPGIKAATGTPEQSCYDHAVPSLHSLYQSLAAQIAPGGRLVVTGYPAPFGKKWDKLSIPTGCIVAFAGPEMLSVSATDATWLTQTVAPELNKTILDEVRKAQKWAAKNRPDITIRYAPDSAAFENHRLCDKQQSWINGIFGDLTIVPIHYEPKSESLHPNTDGHAAIASYIRGAFGVNQ